MTELLEIGLSSWIIADGNYANFSVGNVRSFALEYYNEADLQPAPAAYSHRHIKDARHAVRGRKVHLTPTWCVIDFGLLAYRELHSFAAPPASFSGEVYLGVDPFFYFESLAREPDAPPLIYNWRVHRIEVQTARRILKDRMMIYDPDRWRWADVPDTKTGEDFLLHCERLPDPPQKKLTHT